MVERFLKAMEAIAEELKMIRLEMQAARDAQQRLSEQGPKKAVELLGHLKEMIGGQINGK